MRTISRKPNPKLPNPATKPLLTVEEVATLLRKSKSYVYEAVRTGAIPAIRLSSRGTRIPTAKLYVELGLMDEARRIYGTSSPQRSKTGKSLYKVAA
jgi:excisionase family DNA binding protein